MITYYREDLDRMVMDFLGDIGSVLWGPWTPYTLLAMGVLFTLWTKFTQYRAMTHGVAVVRGVYDNPDDPGAINHFQALSAALSATVGLGNIGGVALAIGAGGPGALFWMWIVGFFGMALKTVEITLAMMYRNMDDPENPHGGAMWVVDSVIGAAGGVWKIVAKVIGVFFCITLIISTFTGGNMFQAWSVATLTEGYFDVPRIATGIILASVIGLVIIGGIKRIGSVAAKLVPFMCLIYLFSALAVLSLHIPEIPGLLKLIVTSAFSRTDAVNSFIGGSLGWAFIMGMKRALFSNEAGQGSAPIAHAAAKTDEPAREGIVGGIGPFIDTLCICTLTALVILSTGTWNREAIGDFRGTIAISKDIDAGEPAWVIQAENSVGNLPVPRDGDWSAGDRFFFVAEVEGAIHRESDAGRVKWISSIVREDEGISPEAAAPVSIKWDPLIISSESWEGDPENVRLIDTGVYKVYDGARLTGHAFDRQFPGLGKYLVTLAAWLFAVSTMISWSYYGEQGMVYMTGKIGVLPYKLVFLLLVILAATGIKDTGDMEILMDLGTGAMLWSNLPIVLALGFLAVRNLKDYRRRLAAGEFPKHGARKNPG